MFLWLLSILTCAIFAVYLIADNFVVPLHDFLIFVLLLLFTHFVVLDLNSLSLSGPF